ncbi:IS66 family insertion sequence element accessory protein TnpA [Ammoniphilus resinae]|uniref:Transposase n=1 Tax=Ammoniphilus resinae TaxID=861532 RepID=A0ABS4GYE2_9BACL|nr:hypothetical protein [Ammoniphilus resinae]MBP1935127.1 hypothetical protein [Ammoniphilus resinae]
MAEVTRKLSSQEWDELIENYHSSGLSAAKWCADRDLKVNQLRWQITKRQKLNKNNQSIHWVSLHTNSSATVSSSITVKIGNAEISVSDGFNKELFAEVVHSLLTLC